ncbi:MAG: TIGR03905 family TSCPD domain-containing protein [Negativibacillus sp.]
MHYVFQPQGVCCKQIELDIENGVIHNTRILGGCPGNLKALGLLVEGQTPQWVIDRVKGVTCGPKPTSCSDQLARMLELVLEEEKKQGK